MQGLLWRSGGPLNAAGKRSYDDEKYFRKILSACTPAAIRGVIYDLRGQAEAKVRTQLWLRR